MSRLTQATQSYLAAADGVRLFYQRVGEGPRALLVPNAVYLFEDFQRLASGRTVIFFDLRNRGRSDAVTDEAKLAAGIHNDVSDLEAVRRHFGFEKVDLLGHSYVGLIVALYAMKYPERVNRVVQIGPVAPQFAKQYPPHLTGVDAIMSDVFAKMAQLQTERTADPRELCRKFWALLRVLNVGDAADADKLHWEPCDVPNELAFMGYWNGQVLPSIHKLELTADDFAKVQAPMLTIHGRKDRSAPYGGGRDWAMLLPDARLLTIAKAAHVPWIEEPEHVFGSITRFLDGAWPEAAEKVEALEPAQ